MLVLIARLILAAVFALASFAKLARREETESTVEAFGAPVELRRPLAFGLPLVELGIAAALLPPATAPFAGVAALLLLGVFTFFVARVLARGEQVDCNCFGSLGPSRISRWTLVRNLVLMVPAAIVAGTGWSDAGPSAVAWVGDVDGVAAVGIVAGVALLAAVLSFAFSWQLMRQNGRLLERLDALEGDDRRERGILAGLGEPMPRFELPDLSGRPVSLDDLLTEDRGVLLVFTDPGCHACDPLLPEIGRRQRSAGPGPVPVVISRGDAAANRAKVAEHGIERILLQEGFDLPKSVGVAGMPGAIAVDGEGRIASKPTLGTEPVRELLESSDSVDDPMPELRLTRVEAGR
ncbi:MAG: redoxin domain-containing protein [Actinobacteria bacterium]|nr:redoxin domain-containing protein [Actinomycetota bacterium]